jgi:hypothetical protein
MFLLKRTAGGFTGGFSADAKSPARNTHASTQWNKMIRYRMRQIVTKRATATKYLSAEKKPLLKALRPDR